MGTERESKEGRVRQDSGGKRGRGEEQPKRGTQGLALLTVKIEVCAIFNPARFEKFLLLLYPPLPSTVFPKRPEKLCAGLALKYSSWNKRLWKIEL